MKRGRVSLRSAPTLLLAVASIFALGMDSCQFTGGGFGEVGNTTCLSCHDGRSASDRTEFLVSPHQSMSCESCHGPGLNHVREGGRFGHFIDNPEKGPFAVRHESCAECHGEMMAPRADNTAGFLATAHFMAEAATCTDCHDVHKRGGMTISSESPLRFSNENYGLLCGQCHESQVDDFALSGHATKNIANCSSCHDMHRERMFRATPEDNRICLQCHQSFALGFETDGDVDFHTGVIHPVDPAGTGASRCTGCHLPPLPIEDGERVAHDHTLFTIPPVASNEAVALGADPAPPNSCAGVTGCHDAGIAGSGPDHDENNLDNNESLQSLYEFIGALP